MELSGEIQSPERQLGRFEPRELIASSNYIASLTGVHAIAASLVLSFHSAQNLPPALPLIFPFIQRGYLGVDLFFILSSFVITHVYWRFMKVWSLGNVKVFLWHRFIRLYPAHFTVLLSLTVSHLNCKAFGSIAEPSRGLETRSIN